MEDETLVRKLLNAVPDRYLQIVALIEQYSDLSEMTMKEAIGRLKTYEERIKYKRDKQVNSQESLMFTQHEGQRKPFREYGHERFNQSRGREQDKNDYQSKREERATRDKSQVKIPVVHITDHIAKQTIMITRALHITKSLQIILILLLDDGNLTRWKEQLLRAVNINDATGDLLEYSSFVSSACRRTAFAEDDIEVFSTEPGLDRISAQNFLTWLQKLSSYASGHVEVSELVACLEKASFSSTSGHVEVFQNLPFICHP
uniref:Zinc finger, CCHC-type n=1 Tax=Tanacetum cinerariifolium TaxID=118510 RepID=A0A6L2NM88_TANCI|nr:zinc finger, CCHC-type [Tanacetum cinerariifolium]